MKKSNSYLPCVILSVLMVFTLIGTSAAFTFQHFMNYDYAVTICKQHQLDSKVNQSLQKYFDDKVNTTGIPSDIYMKSISNQWIDDTMKLSLKSGFDFLTNKNTDSYNFNPDFSAVDSSLDSFFSDYAEKNGYQKDSVFENKLDSAKQNAHQAIKDYTDILKFNTLYSEGVLKSVRTYTLLATSPILSIAILACLAILFALTLLFCRKNKIFTLYWIATSILVSSAIILIPCIYLKATNYFDSFVIKQEQIFIAFTSYMYSAVNFLITLQIILSAAAVIMLAVCVIFSKSKKSTANV